MFAKCCFAFVPRNLISIQLALVIVFSLMDYSAQAQSPRDAKELIRDFKQLPQWKHLDESIVDELAQVPRGGPRVHYTVEVVTADQKPVPEALVVLFESSSDLVNSIYRTIERWDKRFLEMPLDISATDAQGRVIRTDVRTSRHVQPTTEGRQGFAQLNVLVIHPDWGWTAQMLPPNSGPHSVKIQMLPTSVIKGRFVVPETNPIDPAIVNAQLTFGAWSSHAFGMSDSDSISIWKLPFKPQATITADGTFEWLGMPSTGWISMGLASTNYQVDFEGVQERNDYSREITGKAMEVKLKPKQQQSLEVRVVDLETKEPIANCQIPGWLSNETTNELGIATLTAYQAFPTRENPAIKNVFLSLHPTTDHFPVNVYEVLPEPGRPLEIALERGVKINGRVFDQASNAGIQDIEIALQDSETPPNRLSRGTPQGKTPLLIATTDISGRFETVVPKKKLMTKVNSLAFGYEVPLPSYLGYGNEPTKTFDPPEPLQIEVDLTNKNSYSVEIPLRRAIPLQGKVIGLDNKPLSDAVVDVSLTRLAKPYHFQTKTDNDGGFQLPFIPNLGREAFVVATKDSMRTSGKATFNSVGSFSAKPMELRMAEQTPPRSIKGRVLIDNEPAPGVSVVAYSMAPPNFTQGVVTTSYGPDNTIGSATTDAKGFYSVEVSDSETQNAEVRIVAPEYLAMSSWHSQRFQLGDEETKAPEMHFKSKYGDLTITGEIFSPDADPVQGATIHAIQEESNVELIRRNRTGETDSSQDTTGVSDEEGRFICKNLGEGKVQLQLRSGPADFWSSPMFQSFKTLANSQDLVFVLDPKLIVPPKLVEPVETFQLNLPSIHQRFAANGESVTLRGRVVNEQKVGVEDATVFVFAAKPMEGLGSVNAFLHPFCGLETKTSSSGEFELVLPDNSQMVRLAMGKSGYTASVTDYLRPSKPSPIQASIKPVKSSLKRKFVNSNQLPIANALIAVSKQYMSIETPDEFPANADFSMQLSDRDGTIRIEDQRQMFSGSLLAIKPGYPATVENHFYGDQVTLKRPWGVEGRVMNAEGPVANYTVLCSAQYGNFSQRTKTDAQGFFRFEQCVSQDQQQELLLYGDPNERDERGWFKTCRLKPLWEGNLVRIPDVLLDECRTIKVEINDLSGKPIINQGTLTYRLRQQNGNSSTIKLQGAKFQTIVGMPSEPLIVTFSLGRAKIIDIQPTLQRVGFEEMMSTGIPMDEDIQLTYTISQ
jgi:protocatechuate 3,4-dioxygenase beta subunit